MRKYQDKSMGNSGDDNTKKLRRRYNHKVSRSF